MQILKWCCVWGQLSLLCPFLPLSLPSIPFSPHIPPSSPVQDLTPASVTSALHILSSLSDAAAADALFTFLTSHPVSRRISKGSYVRSLCVVDHRVSSPIPVPIQNIFEYTAERQKRSSISIQLYLI